MDDAAAVFAAPKQTSYENTYRTSPEEYGEESCLPSCSMNVVVP